MSTLTAPRITARIDLETQEMLKTAAAISGISSINAFVLNAAIKEAHAVIEQQRVIELDEEMSSRLINALNHPPPANDKLRQLFQTNFNHEVTEHEAK